MMMLKLIITVLRLGDHQFYGPGSEFVLDTTKPFTVVTQVPFNALVMIYTAKMRIACGNFGNEDFDKSENICSS